jgi:hypothetical protein
LTSFAKLFVYASLAFLLVYLYRFDYFELPRVERPLLLIASSPLLLLGFVLDTLAWRRVLQSDGCQVSTRAALAASGASVFGKYIPGKLWTVVGRATLVARHTELPAARLSLLTLNAQVLFLWTALLFGLVGMSAVGGLRVWGPVWLGLFLVFSLLLFSRVAHRLAERLLAGRWPSLGERLPSIELQTALQVLPWLVLCWVAWSAGFHLLALGVMPESAASSPWMGLGFPLAAAIGIAALFAPGGLGVREGVLAGYLVLAGLTPEWSATIAVLSRLWFLVGELAFFALGMWAGAESERE